MNIHSDHKNKQITKINSSYSTKINSNNKINSTKINSTLITKINSS